MTAPSSAPLGTTSGTTTSTTDLPYPQIYSLGDGGFKADVGANVHQLSGSVSPTTTSVTIPLGSLSPEGSILFDAKFANLVVVNGSNESIQNVILQFTDTIGADTVTINYPVFGINPSTQSYTEPVLNIGTTSGSNFQNFPIRINQGVLKTAQVIVDFGTAPTSGTVNAQLNLSSIDPGRVVLPWRKLGSVPYTAFGTGTGYNFQTLGVLNEQAQSRTILIALNGLTTGISSSNLLVFDQASYTATGTNNDRNALNVAIPQYTSMTLTSLAQSASNANYTQMVGVPGDSLEFNINLSATPTGGSIDIYAQEMV